MLTFTFEVQQFLASSFFSYCVLLPYKTKLFYFTHYITRRATRIQIYKQHLKMYTEERHTMKKFDILYRSAKLSFFCENSIILNKSEFPANLFVYMRLIFVLISLLFKYLVNSVFLKNHFLPNFRISFCHHTCAAHFNMRFNYPNR